LRRTAGSRSGRSAVSRGFGSRIARSIRGVSSTRSRCDYGTPTSSFVGTAFPRWSHAFRDHLARGWLDSSATSSLPVHPTELYEAGVGLALFFAVRAMKPNKRGARFVALVIAYALARSVIELVRGDASRGHVGALSTSQVFALVTSAIVLAAFARTHSAKERTA
jgi:phosphatidylglycerol:prolipoprotein diacylglycerol transferase